MTLVFRIFALEDPRGIWEIADLDIPVKTKTRHEPIGIGRALLTGNNVTWRGTLDIDNDDQAGRAGDYFGDKR